MLAPLAALVLKASDPWFGVDKLKHVAACGFIAGDAYWLSLEMNAGPTRRVLYGLGAALAVGASKELIWDLALRRGDPSFRDFTADVVGAVIGTGLSVLLDHVIVGDPKK